MVDAELRKIICHFHKFAAPARAGGLADPQLLERWVNQRDEAAFEVLLWRHGPMVLHLCRRILRRDQDAEDAFQATFLVLVRRAASISKRTSVASWLYKVAYRVALAASARAAKQAARENPLVDHPAPTPSPGGVRLDQCRALDEEINRLPEKYRVPLVLCYLQGKTNDEAAQELGWPRGTVATRLAWARERLRARLTRRGLTLLGGTLAAIGAGDPTRVPLPATLAQTTTDLAAKVARGQTAGVVSANVAALMEGVLRAMTLTKLKVAALVLLVLAAIGIGSAVGISQTATEGPTLPRAGVDRPTPAVPEPAAPAPAKAPDQDKVWTLDFHFKDPRLISVDVPGRGRTPCWYLWYWVDNPTDQPHTFVPEITLVLPDKADVVRDCVLPTVQEAIRALEDSADYMKVRNSVTVAAQPIPPAKPGPFTRPVHGVAIWDAVPPDVTNFSILVSGLSNASTVTDGPDGKPVVRRKTLRLKFKREDDKIRFVPPAEWLYRAEMPKPEPNERHQPQKEPEGRQTSPEEVHALLVDGENSLQRREAEIERTRSRQIQLEQYLRQAKAAPAEERPTPREMEQFLKQQDQYRKDLTNLLVEQAVQKERLRELKRLQAELSGGGRAENKPDPPKEGSPASAVQVLFVSPVGGRLSPYPAGDEKSKEKSLELPGRRDFAPGATYRFELTGLPNQPGFALFPTLEVPPMNPQTKEFLTHSFIPVEFTAEELALAETGTLVTRVYYLPDGKDANPAGTVQVVSSAWKAGDAVAEAKRRGQVLAIMRLGGINLKSKPR